MRHFENHFTRLGVLISAAILVCAVCPYTVVLGEDGDSLKEPVAPVALADLTEEERNRPASEWTLEQIKEKGWIPYDCFHFATEGRAQDGRRWPKNDPDGTKNGTCITWSVMPDGVAMEPGPPAEGPNRYAALMPAGSTGEIAAAVTTWEGAADIHLTNVADGGGPWNAGGPAGMRGDIRVGAGNIANPTVLAHAYYPPPNGVSAAGDLHFDAYWWWVTAGGAPHPLGGPPFDVQTVALHELGHSLGLNHDCTRPIDAMFPAYTGQKRALNGTVAACAGPSVPPACGGTCPGDIAYIQGIYGAGGHAAECVGACCFKRDECGDRTEAACAAQGGTWRGQNGTRCPKQGGTTVQHRGGPVIHYSNPSMNCFNITREERGTSGCIPGVLIDAWMTEEDEPTEATCHEFGTHECSPPIPADFFEPGSEPFVGSVCVKGEPLGPTQWGEFGEADTLVLRTEEPFTRCDVSSAVERTVDIEIVALSLVSLDPVTVMVNGQPTQWNMAVDLSTVPSPLGTLTAIKTHCNGGTYNSVLPVQPRFTFTKVSGPGIPAGSEAVLDTGEEVICPILLVTDDSPPWVNVVEADLYYLDTADDECSEFHPGIEEPDTTTDCDCDVNQVHDSCDILACISGDLTCADCNFNGRPDQCDPDTDFDGVPDDCDNCLDHPNPDQLDANNDGVGDLCGLNIPTVTEWGVVVMILLVLAAGTIVFTRLRASGVQT